jgi:hypothetical protein
MILKENKAKTEAIQHECAVLGLTCNIYTIENNDNLVQVEILDKFGERLDEITAYRLGGLVMLQYTMQNF